MNRFCLIFSFVLLFPLVLVVGDAFEGTTTVKIEDSDHEDRRRPGGGGGGSPGGGGGGGTGGGGGSNTGGFGWRYRRRRTPLREPIVFCYWGNWANLRPGLGAFGVQDMPLDLCTHIAYSFIGLTADGDLTIPEVYHVDGKSNSVEDFIGLKRLNSSLNLMVAVGGWSEGSKNFSIVANNETLRGIFVNNIVEYMAEKGFNGLDVDWEYPGQQGGAETDRDAFVLLLRDLRNAFDSRRWILTAAVAPTQYHIDISYDVPGINRHVHFINLMAYDYYGAWSERTGANAPLFPQLTDATDNGLNVNASVYSWIMNGADREKLVLGLAAYGKTYTLTDLDQTSTGAPFEGPGIPGPFTNEDGLLSFLEICTDQRNNLHWNVTVVNENYVYGNIDNQWVSYDNAHTIFSKGLYASLEDLAGVMFWTLDFEDFHGICSGQRYDLIRNSIEGYRSGANKLIFSQYLFVLIILIKSVFF